MQRGLLVTLTATALRDSRGFDVLRSAESTARRVLGWEPNFFHGLLQTRAYARQTLSMFARQENLEKQVDERIRRQDVLANETCHFVFMMDESAILRPAFEKGVLSEQIEHALKVSALPHVEIFILPFSYQAPILMYSPFYILERSANPDDDLLFCESPDGDILSHGDQLPELISGRKSVIEHARSRAVRLDELLA